MEELANSKVNTQEICEKLEKLYDETENKVKADAIVNRAFVDKTSVDTINDKVSSQINSIKTEIYNINPKFKEGSKNYEQTKKLVAETLANYEQALIDLSTFYDNKIEQLILRKVELEANLVALIVNDEYLDIKVEKRKSLHEKDQVKKTVRENIKAIFDRFAKKKEEKKEVNPVDIIHLMDQKDLQSEIDEKIENRISKTQEDKKDNKNDIEKIENEISLINLEIERINNQKKESIYNAMEVGDKQIDVYIKKPRVFSRITRFFVSRFNTAKAVENSVITPLKLRIDNFKNNELSNMKG